MSTHSTRSTLAALMTAVIWAPLIHAQAVATAPAAPTLSFSGYVDADFASSFGSELKDPQHLTGLEVDLTTTVTFSPTVNAVLYTTMNDGAIPAQGAGNTWAPVKFDGATLNWQYDPKTLIHVGDIINGSGYFNYYLNKRTALVVGEHALRGVGIERDGWTVATGATGLGAVDTAGNPTATSQWATYVKYVYPLNEKMTLAPSLKYVGGVPGATPVNGGLSFDGSFGELSLSADAALNYYNSDTDPGFSVLVEPTWARGKYTVAGALYFNEKGSDPGRFAPNGPAQTVTGAALDHAFIYVEPGYAYSDRVAFGLPLEYHDAHLDVATTLGYDQSVWVVPTVYVYPGSGIQWWIWGQVITPLTGIGPKDPLIFAGSELIFKF